VQIVFTATVMGAVAWLAWTKERPELRNALVCSAAVLSTPYVLDYDLLVLLPALAWLYLDGRKNGVLHWDVTLMAFIWFAPLIARTVAEWTLVPLGLISILAAASITLGRWIRALPSRHSHEAFAL
jgi:hypothetical protein